ncbi:MAG TPA: tetratricopeptide repeat protein [Tenuifilaceae bacterium]|nr:tetratricopeptide repeat protein [Tenuifilaceae bacterium]HPE17085.1 tetratricopeptide repeat protein [Tenuifilaceae bacterium]HPJ44813.1 tetratricopeptide repeat protein [Tenuifilaceae bacterium]HPQ32893.1 tetratricopeptide repeat protein [Tenuifilaceae bacterium]HRX67178.1 tetratricopeptide repeat protein [Tenuifilaceae bacterium]
MYKISKYLLAIFVCVSFVNCVFSENTKVDSIKILFEKAAHDTTKIGYLLELGDIFETSNPNEAISYYQEGLALAQKLDLPNIEKTEHIITCNRLIGLVYYNLNTYDKAMEYFMESLKLSESIGYKPGIIASFNNIGMIHESLGNFTQSVDYYNKSIDLSKEIGDNFGVARGYNNIGISYANQGKVHLAIANYARAADAFEKSGNKYYKAVTHNNIGTYYLGIAYEKENPDSNEYYYNQAKINFEKALVVFREMEELYDMATCLVNLSQAYYQLHILAHGFEPTLSVSLQKAIDYAEESLKTAQRIKSFGTIFFAAFTLRDINRILGNYKTSLEYADLIVSNNDSLFLQEKDRTIAEIEAQYQTEKKEQLIERQNLEAKRQATFRNALIISLALTLLFALSIFIGYRNKRKANTTIKEQYEILGQANAEILAQRDELEAQRDMLMNQNQRLEEAHTHITDSLHYAQSIQAAILPSEKIVESISPNYFIIMKPFQVVSGDFFWAVTINEYKIFGIADCTGHGVPGAFMSILGLNALNDIIVRHRIVEPDIILNYLRDSVINALGQNDPNQLHKDGIDIALCTFNSKTKELQYSGAGIPLWMVLNDDSNCKTIKEKHSKNAFYLNSHSLFEVKADIMPVGVSPLVKPFTKNTFSLKNCSASIYLATDGFADQFGGTDGTKFGSARLKNLILQNADKTFVQQKKIISTDFESWISTHSQVDDVAILGIML